LKKPTDASVNGLFNGGRGDRIRTYDPLLPKQVRYQAAPHPETATYVALWFAQGNTEITVVGDRTPASNVDGDLQRQDQRHIEGPMAANERQLTDKLTAHRR
jgi:hypothetical protein